MSSKLATPVTKSWGKVSHNLLVYFVLSSILILMSSCGGWGWESIETDNDESLNVFGLISLDDSLESFIVVHKTLDTAGPDQVEIGRDTTYFSAYEWYNEDTGETERDTFWYEPPLIQTLYESLYLVKDADVSISDGVNSYSFVRSPSTDPNNAFYWNRDLLSDPAIYRNVDKDFTPQPNTAYDLHISTPDGLEMSGSLVTPPRPQIIESSIADTLSLKALFQVSWNYPGDYGSSISTGKADNNRERYICGIDQNGIIEAGDTTWNSTLDSWCFDQTSEPDLTAEMLIRLKFMDENYYRYFLGFDDDVASISNFLIGEGGIGNAQGVEGGYGVFGAISADWTKRIVTP